jgi:hypothetical protein
VCMQRLGGTCNATIMTGSVWSLLSEVGIDKRLVRLTASPVEDPPLDCESAAAR